MPAFMFEGVNKLYKVTLVEALAHYIKALGNIVVAIKIFSFTSQFL